MRPREEESLFLKIRFLPCVGTEKLVTSSFSRSFSSYPLLWAKQTAQKTIPVILRPFGISKLSSRQHEPKAQFTRKRKNMA